MEILGVVVLLVVVLLLLVVLLLVLFVVLVLFVAVVVLVLFVVVLVVLLALVEVFVVVFPVVLLPLTTITVLFVVPFPVSFPTPLILRLTQVLISLTYPNPSGHLPHPASNSTNGSKHSHPPARTPKFPKQLRQVVALAQVAHSGCTRVQGWQMGARGSLKVGAGH